MIIKFQIYSILHPIPSKGILESHTNVLLNRKRILNFYFTIFFSGTGKREVPSTYLRNASVYTPRPPNPKQTLGCSGQKCSHGRTGIHISRHALLSRDPPFQHLQT